MDEEKRITLGQLEMTAERIKQDYDEKFGNLNENVATTEEVEEMLDDVFGAQDADTQGTSLTNTLADKEEIQAESEEESAGKTNVSGRNAKKTKHGHNEKKSSWKVEK